MGVQLGKVRIGDWVKVHYRARIASTGKECLDTYLAASLTQFQVKENSAAEYTGLYRGLNECVKTMIFGEESRFIIPSEYAFGSEGLTKALIMKSNGKQKFKPDHVDRNPSGVSLNEIGPYEDLVVDLAVFKLARNGTWHYRAISKENTHTGCLGCINSRYHSSIT